MTIILTGSHGLIGSAIAARLQKAGTDALFLSRANGFDLANLGVMPFTECQIFIHAAWAGTDNALRNDEALLALNYKATLQLLEIAADAGCKKFITFGSQAEYSDGLNAPIHETAPTEPSTTYGKTKLSLCLALQEAAARRSVELVWLRLFTCYGANQNTRYILPYLLATLSRGELPSINTPLAVWDFLHTEDAAAATLTIASMPYVSDIYNLASGVGISVAELALMIARMVKFPHMAALEKLLKRNDSPTYRIANIDKITRDFGWRPAISLSEGLAGLLQQQIPAGRQ